MGKSARQIEQDKVLTLKKRQLASKNACNAHYIGAGLRTDLDRLESRCAQRQICTFRHFAAIWVELDFHAILTGHPSINESSNYCERDFVEELYFILIERLVADVRSKTAYRAVVRLFALFGVNTLAKTKIRLGIKQLESLDGYWRVFRDDRLNREAFVIYKKLVFNAAFSIVAVKRTCLLGNMFTSSAFTGDYCQAALYEKNEKDQAEKAEIFDTTKVSDLSVEYEHIYRAMLDRKEMRGQNWSHRNAGETIYETGQLIEQLDSRPLQLKNQMKAIELRANFRRRTNSETKKKVDSESAVALVVSKPKTKRRSIVTKADFDAEKHHPMAIRADEMKHQVMAEIDKIYNDASADAKQLIDEREQKEELKQKRDEDRRRELNLERAQNNAKEAETKRTEVAKRRVMDVKNERRRLERKIARLDRGQWQRQPSPTKAPNKIEFHHFIDQAKLEQASIVVLDSDATDSWPACPVHLAIITGRDSEDEMLTTKLAKFANNKIMVTDNELAVSFDDVKFTVANVALNTKLTAVQLETLRQGPVHS